MVERTRRRSNVVRGWRRPLALVVVVLLFLLAHARFGGELSILLGAAPRFLPWYGMLALIALGALLGAFSAHLNLKRLLGT